MKTNLILPLLALTGFLFASYTVVSGNKPAPIAHAVVEPSTAPYKAFIAGAGIIEAKSQNIAIGTSLPGVVKTVSVRVGDNVKAGDVLFLIDDREYLAELAIRKADLIKAVADVKVAEASLADAKSLLGIAEAVTDRRAISNEEVLKRRNALLIANAKRDSANAYVAQTKAGIANTEATLERLVVRAPVDCAVLQVNIRPGEYAQAGALATPLMVLGNLDQFHVRVDIDENDAWRFDKTGKAIAYLRGNRNFKAELTLAYVEPFVIPKKSLTGDSTERVDTRVLQALYSFNHDHLPVYVGQQMDVFIEAQEDSNAKKTETPASVTGTNS